MAATCDAIHPSDAPRVTEHMALLASQPGTWGTIQFRVRRSLREETPQLSHAPQFAFVCAA